MKRLLILLLALAALAAGGCALPLVSEAEIESQSEAEFEKMRQTTLVSNDARTRSYVGCIARAIVDELDEPYASMDWDLEVFENEAINAFAMPGGKIGVFTGILSVADDQDKLAAVIGHEVAHVTERHSLERANQQLTTQIGVIGATAAIGGPRGTGDLIAMGAQLGLSLPYGRGQESEADTVGLLYMADAGFDPRASIKLWKNMAAANQGGPPEFFSTHPSSDSRIDDLIEQLPEALARYNAAKAAGKNPNCQR
jgi:predicted Zn-dependent protease